MSVVVDRSRPGLWGLAGLLACLCLGLFLAAVEHRPTLAAWRAFRDAGSASLARARTAFETSTGTDRPLARPKPPSRAAATLEAPQLELPALRLPDLGPASRAAPEDRPLAGRFVADEPAAPPLDAIGFQGADVTLSDGRVLATEPIEIASGGDRFGPGVTYARRLRASPDAQIELRRIRGQAAALAVCDGRAPYALALLPRQDRLDLILFRKPEAADRAPSDVTCGVWSYRAS